MSPLYNGHFTAILVIKMRTETTLQRVIRDCHSLDKEIDLFGLDNRGMAIFLDALQKKKFEENVHYYVIDKFIDLERFIYLIVDYAKLRDEFYIYLTICISGDHYLAGHIACQDGNFNLLLIDSVYPVYFEDNKWCYSAFYNNIVYFLDTFHQILAQENKEQIDPDYNFTLTSYINVENLQVSAVGCRIFALDAIRHLLSFKERHKELGYEDIFSYAATKVKLELPLANEQKLLAFSLPLHLLKSMQSVSNLKKIFLEYFDKEETDKELLIKNKKGTTAHSSICNFFKTHESLEHNAQLFNKKKDPKKSYNVRIYEKARVIKRIILNFIEAHVTASNFQDIVDTHTMIGLETIVTKEYEEFYTLSELLESNEDAYEI